MHAFLVRSGRPTDSSAMPHPVKTQSLDRAPSSKSSTMQGAASSGTRRSITMRLERRIDRRIAMARRGTAWFLLSANVARILASPNKMQHRHEILLDDSENTRLRPFAF